MKLLSSLLLLLLPAIAYTQTSDYRLDSYVNPDYKRKELDFNFRTSGGLSSQKIKYELSSTEVYNNKTKNKNFSGDIDALFYQVINSTKKQTSTYFLINTAGNYLNDGYSDEKNKDYKFYMSYYQSGYYYTSGKKFFEFSPSAYFNYDSSVSSSNNPETLLDTEETYNGTSANLSFKSGIGKGRIERVEDAYLAMYIISDLNNNGSLKKTLSPEEVNMLAQQMTSIKNKRQFDSRIKLIEEIATVDSFLIANGYTNSENKVAYYTSLYDNWMYAGLFERAAGSRFSIGISPGYYWSHYNIKYKPVTDYNNYSHYNSETNISAYISYQYEKPVNLYLQHSIYTDIRGEWRKARDENGSIGPLVSGGYSLGYYPNTRTHIRSSCSINYSSRHNDDYNHYNLQSGLRLNLYYYLSPQLRLSADSGLNFIYNNYKDKQQNLTNMKKYPNLSFNIGLQYSIF